MNDFARRHHTGLRRGVLASLLVMLLLSLALPVRLVLAEPEEAPTIRVGFPIQHGLTELDESGKPTGYTYDYLQEIAQFTGWNYEFVQIPGADLNTSLLEFLDMLENGEIDLLGAMSNSGSLADLYDYPGYSYGTAYSTLQVLTSNTALNETNYLTLPVIRVAVLNSATQRNGQLVKFCETNNLKLEMVKCADDKEQLELLRQGRADAILNVDLNHFEGLRTIAKFSPQPYYFATTKGNSTVVNGLNSAILKLNEGDPYLSTRLYEKYFAPEKLELMLSDEERAYIETAGPLDVAFTSGKAPFQYLDQDGNIKGIAVDFLDYISEKTGLSFNKRCAASEEEYQSWLNEDQVALAAAIPYDYELSSIYDVSLSRAYATSQVIMAVNKRINSTELQGKRLALSAGLSYSGEYQGVVEGYGTIEDCIAAVNAGKADYCYGNGYSIQYYANQEKYKNIYLVPQTDRTQDMCLGLTKPFNTNLLTIINKVIAAMPDDYKQAIIYRNVSDTAQHITFFDYVSANPYQALALVGLIFLIILLSLLFYLYLRIQNSRKVALDNERYKLLFELSNEYIFEYRFAEDRMLLSDKSAQVFHCDSVIEHFYETILNEPPDPDTPYIKEIYYEVVRNNHCGPFEVQIPMPDGPKRWFRITLMVVYDKSGNTVSSIGKITDIQSEREEMDRLINRAQMDSLTDVYNSAAFRKIVTEHLEQTAGNNGGALLIIDVDHFKSINDRFGHLTGDQVLRQTTDLMKQVFNPDSSILGRLGGDEFLIYLDQVRTVGEVKEKCSLLNETLSSSLKLRDGSSATVSIGAALVSAPLDYDALYQKADQALYLVKSRGRNGHEVVN